MWRLTLFLISLGGISPTLSVGDIDGSLPGHSTDTEGSAQNAWYPGISLLGPDEWPSLDQQAPASDSRASTGERERESVDLEMEVWCIGGQLTLGVGTKLDGVELNPEALTLGNGCKSNGLSVDHLWFTYDLSLCATRESMLSGNVVYSNFLHYTPDPSNPALKHIEAFSLPVRCALDRPQDYSSPVMMSVPVSTKSSSPGFSLRTLNSSWTGAAETSVYRQGQPVRLQAAVERLEDEQQLYVHSCHATAAPDPKSRPRVRLVVKKGCVAHVVSKRGQARFVPSGRTDAVNFMFAAFHFITPKIYLHCEMAILERKMTPTSKFCNYNPKKQRWEELSGDLAVCSCCRTECSDPSPGSHPPGLHALVTIGPLLVMNQTAVEDSKPAASAPLPSRPPVAMETTPSPAPPQPYPTAFPEPTPPGYPDVVMQAWAGQFAPDSVAFLDGMPVREGGWEQPPGTPQRWLAASVGSTRVTWVYPPVVAEGGLLRVSYVPEEPGLGHVPVDPLMGVGRGQIGASGTDDSLVSLQVDDDDILRYHHDDPDMQLYHHDDPSAQVSWWDSAGDGDGHGLPPVSDPVLEESRRKQWGADLGALIKNQQLPEPADRKGVPSSHGDEDPLVGVALDDEGLVVQRSELVMHKGRGLAEGEVLSAFRSRLALTQAEGAAQKLRYEEEDVGMADEDRTMKRRVLLEEENVQPSSLGAVLRRMYKAE